MSNPSRQDLLNTAQALCSAFASKAALDGVLLSNLMSENVVCWEHGLHDLAPFLDQPFHGLDGAQQYFALIGSLLDYKEMIFSDYMVDIETREVSVRGQARFIWKDNQNEWQEQFVYRLRFDQQSKITHYEVWADSGAAYLARLGELGRGRVVLITYEFTFDPFSGNGILARSLVKSLLELGYAVTVWCCRPSNSKGNNHLEFPELSSHAVANRLELIPITLESKHGWKRLDDQSAWQQFVIPALSANQQDTLLRRMGSAVAICTIDWTGANAVRSIPQSFRSPLVYLNFRVYSSGIADAKQHEWYDAMEIKALEGADRIIVLSDKDRGSLLRLMTKEACPAKDIDILLPPLRGDMWTLATQNPNDLEKYLPPEIATLANRAKGQRFLLTCVVRQSPEKTVLRFITMVRKTRDLLSSYGIVPVLAGSRADPEYAARLKRELLELSPDAIVLESFLSPQSLAAIFSRTLLNFHPCAYDAYGMTVVEAAAQGAVSVVASGKTVGASALLGGDASLEVSMRKAQETDLGNVDEIRALIQDEVRLGRVGEEARRKALAWDETAYGTKLLEIIQQARGSDNR